MSTIKEITKRILQSVGLLGHYYKIVKIVRRYEPRILYKNFQYRRKGAPDNLPIPPSSLIIVTAETYDIARYIETGVLATQSIVDILEKNGLNIGNFGTILDFGCGSGRVLRRWKYLKGPKLYGTDYNLKLINWCKRNIPFVQFETNDLSPQLNYGDGSFDFIYAISVFTHLGEALQLSWMNEFLRLLKPSGFLLITTHGENQVQLMTPSEQKQFRAGVPVVWYENEAGTNKCCAFHPVQ